MKKISPIIGISYKLRPVSLDDAKFIVEMRTSDPERVAYIHPISKDIESQKKWIKKYLDSDNDYYFVIENLLTKEDEGLIGLYNISVNETAEWGRWIIKPSSFAATESVLLIYKFGFQILNLKEIYCRTIVNNTKVISFHNSIHQKSRGVIQNFAKLNDKYFDVEEHFVNKEYFVEFEESFLSNLSVKILQRNIRNILPYFKFHHVGYATNNISQEMITFSYLGFKKESEFFVDEKQGIKGAFFKNNEGFRIEFLSNLENFSTLTPFLNKGIKVYHFGFLVKDFEKAIILLENIGMRVIQPPKLSEFFKKRICFLINKNMFITELIEI